MQNEVHARPVTLCEEGVVAFNALLQPGTMTHHHHWPWERTSQRLVQRAGGDDQDTHYQRYYKMMPSGLDFPCQAKSIWRRSVPLLLTEAVGWASAPEWCRRPSFCLLFAYFFFFLKLLWSFVSIRSGLCETFGWFA